MGAAMTCRGLNSDPREDYTDTGTIDAEDLRKSRPERRDTTVSLYPAPPAPEAFRGLLGDFVACLDPHTEADRVAILIQALAAFGNLIGRSPHVVLDGTVHGMNLFAVLVAASSKGRKGTAWSHVRNTFTAIDDTWRHVSGLSTGEGLIYHVRDAQDGGTDSHAQEARGRNDEGVSDKRLFVAEPEFARVLRVCEREGATLSAVLREAWDSGGLATLTKNNAQKATGAHVSLIGHITAEELRRYLTATEAGNGFGNRFLWVCAKRSKYLPDGGRPDEKALTDLRRQIGLAVFHSRTREELRRDEAASAHWRVIYRELSEGQPGLLGSMTGRAEAQVMRLACLYALIDACQAITLEHLKAALALWRYCLDSARFIFGDSLANPIADDLRLALREAGALGLTRAEMSREVLGRNRSAREIRHALDLLHELNLAWTEAERTGVGRPVERWYTSEATN